jgi:hypothetical protein
VQLEAGPPAHPVRGFPGPGAKRAVLMRPRHMTPGHCRGVLQDNRLRPLCVTVAMQHHSQ